MTDIKDFKPNEMINTPLLIKSVKNGTTSKGDPYLNLVLQDKTGSIDGKFWNAKPSDEEVAIEGKVVEVEGVVNPYNNSLQLRVNKLIPLNQDEVDMTAFIQSSKYTEEELKQEIKKYINSIENTTLRTLVSEMFKKHYEKFFVYPAANSIHHGYVGGLAEHTLGMARTAEAMCSLYPTLNKDLLISGVLVHDMGKIAELGGVISTEYSTEGKLTGHISICHGWLVEIADENGLSNTEETLLLRHMILSHHGKLEFGSPVLPEIREAEILSFIDNIDARMNTLNRELENVEKGEWTGRINALEGRRFYKPKL